MWVTVDRFSLREVLRQRTWKEITRIGADKPVGGGEKGSRPEYGGEKGRVGWEGLV